MFISKKDTHIEGQAILLMDGIYMQYALLTVIAATEYSAILENE